jgi:DNA-binding NarL/FixJ family response regulator
MEFLTSFMDENIPYLTLLMGLIACLLLYLGLGHQLQKLRRALRLQMRRVDSLERQLATPEQSERETAEPAATRQKVLQLHGLGRSSEEIARQAGLREADVDFVLRVNEHLETSGRLLALRKIS